MDDYVRWRKKRNNDKDWGKDFMKILLVIFLAVTIILGLYYLVKSLVFVGFLTVIGIGLYFLISKKLKKLNE